MMMILCHLSFYCNRYVTRTIKRPIYSAFLFFSLSPLPCVLILLAGTTVYEHISQVQYTCVWNIFLLFFQTTTTQKKLSPLFIQGDMSMHSASSFQQRESPLHGLGQSSIHILDINFSTQAFIQTFSK